MKNEKIKNRKRIIVLTDSDFYITESGAKFPIKSKPMIFSDMQVEFNSGIAEIQKVEQARESGAVDFDLEAYTVAVNSYLELFYDIVILVSRFNGYNIDIDYIKANMSHADPYWYINSVAEGVALYSVKDLIEKKKKQSPIIPSHTGK